MDFSVLILSLQYHLSQHVSFSSIKFFIRFSGCSIASVSLVIHVVILVESDIFLGVKKWIQPCLRLVVLPVFLGRHMVGGPEYP